MPNSGVPLIEPSIRGNSDLNNQKKESFQKDLPLSNNLPEEISGISSILAIPFEDAELVSLLEAKYPAAKIEVIRKQDIAGIQVYSLVQRLRETKNDLVVASLYNSTANRTASMTELMLSMCRTRRRFIRDTGGRFLKITRIHITFAVVPRLILGSFLGVAFLTLNEISSFYMSFISQARARHLPPNATGGTILFLRTDLAGQLSAGGSVSHVKGVVKAFLDLGYKVVYAADAKSNALPSEVEQFVIQPMRTLDFFDEFQLLAFNSQLTIRASFLVRRFKPVLIYQRLSVFNFAGGIIAKRANVPMILEANASEVWAKRNWSRLFFKKHATRCESIALKLADRVSIVSEVVRDQLAPYKLPSEKIIVSPNGVDPEEFRPSIDGSQIRRQHHLEDTIVVGFIGTFRKEHGVETLCDAAMIAIKRNPQLRFLMIGNGELRSTLQNMTREFGLEKYFVFTGIIPHRDAPKYLAACEILVSPHLGFSQGTRFFQSPIKLFEYMAMGKPIIASRLEQIGDIIVSGINGLWMTPGDKEGLAEKILLLAEDPKLRKKLGDEARNESERKYTWKANVERILRTMM